VWAGLGASGLTLVACLVMALLPARRRRRVRAFVWGRAPARLRHWHEGDPGHTERAPDRRAVDAQLDLSLISVATLWHPERTRVGLGRAVLWALGTGVVAAGVTSAGAGLVVAALVLGGLLVPRGRVVATVAGVLFVTWGCLSVIFGQEAHRYLPGSNWAASFVHSGNLIWLGLVLLLADAVIDAVSGVVRSTPPPGPRAPGEPSRAT
jgi:hypothetical protein